MTVTEAGTASTSSPSAVMPSTAAVPDSPVPDSPVPDSAVPYSAVGTISVRLRLYASAKAAAGVGELVVALPTGSTIADALATLTALPGRPLDRVLARCSFLIDSEATTDRDTVLSEGALLDVMPPFAGG